MKKSFVVGALVAASCISTSAAAQDAFAQSIVPNLTLGWAYGGGAHEARVPMRFTAMLDVRSSFVRQDTEALREAMREGAIDPSLVNGSSLLTVFEVGANRRGFDTLQMLGHDVLQSDRLNADGESSSSHSWIWWTLGAVAVTGGVIAAASSGGGSEHVDGTSNNGNDTNGNQNIPNGCNNFIAVEGGSGTLSVDPNCAVIHTP